MAAVVLQNTCAGAEILFALRGDGAFSCPTYVSMKRTHHCAQLTSSDLGATVSLLGWVDTIRDQGGIIFVDLRDRKGVTQSSSSRMTTRRSPSS